MPSRDAADVIRGNPLFASLPEKDLTALASEPVEARLAGVLPRIAEREGVRGASGVTCRSSSPNRAWPT